MDWRMRLFSYLFAVFFGVLLAQFLFSDSDSPSAPQELPEGTPEEVVELRARLQSEHSLRRQLESRIARLEAANPRLNVGNPAAEDIAETAPETATGIGIVPSSAETGLSDPLATESVSQARPNSKPRTIEEVLTEARFPAIFQVIADRVSLGEIDAAVRDLQQVEEALESLPGGGPLAGLEPFVDGAMNYWVPQVLSSCKGSGAEWLRLFVRVREMEWQGVERGPLLNLIAVDEFLALAVYSIPEPTDSSVRLLLDHMTECFVATGWLSDQELAALSLLPGEEVVRFLERIWADSSQNRDSVLAALTQVSHPSGRALLQRILPQVENLKARSALEIWLKR